MNNRVLVQASELNEYLYCQRKWWYVLCGLKNQNQDALEAGTTHHQVFGSHLSFSQSSQRWGWILIISGLVGLAVLAIFLFKFVLKI